jgi:hypothetical protein
MNGVRAAATIVEVGATAVWVGASAGFAFISAPLAFRLITDRNVFAKLTEQTLARLAKLTYFAGGTATLVALTRAGAERDGRRNDALRAIAGTTALGFIAYHERAIVPAMTQAQAEMGGLNAVAEDDPRRIAYRTLHKRSTRAYGTALLFGIAQLTLAATRSNAGAREF